MAKMAKATRIHLIKVLPGIALALGVGFLVIFAASRREPLPGPMLILRQDAATSTAGPDDASAVALVLATLSPSETAELGRSLEELASRMELRAHPLGIDFESNSPEDSLERTLQFLLPKLTAARALYQPAWQSGARRLTVLPTRFCPESEHCIRAWDSDAGGAHARFLAWPLSTAALISFRRREDRDAALDDLAARAASKESKVALGWPAIRLRNDAAAIRNAARRLTTFIERREAQSDTNRELQGWLEHLAKAPTISEPPIWMEQDEHTIWVLPRLSALSTLEPFIKEVDAVQDAHLGRWLRRPSALR